MKIWTLVWFLVFPPNEDGQVHWKAGQEPHLTQEQCFKKLGAQNVAYERLQVKGEIAGFEIFCRKKN